MKRGATLRLSLIDCGNLIVAVCEGGGGRAHRRWQHAAGTEHELRVGGAGLVSAVDAL